VEKDMSDDTISEAMRALAKRRHAQSTPAERSAAASHAGKARAKKLSAARRKEIARAAVEARWAKARREKRASPKTGRKSSK
jgi:hypothetical protein